MITKEITALPYTEERTKEYLDPLLRMFPNIVQVNGRMIRITAETEDGINSLEARIRNHFHDVNFRRAKSIVSLTETTAFSYHSSLPKNFKEQLFPHDKKPSISTIERETSTTIRVDFTGFIGIFGAKENILEAIKMLNQIFDTQKLDDTNLLHWSKNLKLSGQEPVPADSYKDMEGEKFHKGDSVERDLSRSTRFQIERDFAPLVIGNRGSKKREFERKFKVRILIENDPANENDVIVQVRGLSDDALNKTKQNILQHISRQSCFVKE